VRLVGITSATKGALDNKVSVDIQIVTGYDLTAMAGRYVAIKAGGYAEHESSSLSLRA